MTDPKPDISEILEGIEKLGNDSKYVEGLLGESLTELNRLYMVEANKEEIMNSIQYYESIVLILSAQRGVIGKLVEHINFLDTLMQSMGLKLNELGQKEDQ